MWNQTINELGVAAPCDLAGEWNSANVMWTWMVRETIIPELMRHLDQSFKRLICLSEDRSWSLLAAIALQSSSICFTKAAHRSFCAFQPYMWPLSLNPVLNRVKFKGFSLLHTIKLLIWLLLWGSQALYQFLGIKMQSYILLLWEESLLHSHAGHPVEVFHFWLDWKALKLSKWFFYFFSVSQSLLFCSCSEAVCHICAGIPAHIEV